MGDKQILTEITISVSSQPVPQSGDGKKENYDEKETHFRGKYSFEPFLGPSGSKTMEEYNVIFQGAKEMKELGDRHSPLCSCEGPVSRLQGSQHY